MKFIIDKKIKSTIPSTKLFDLGTDAEIGINNLLDLSTIYIDQNIIPILKINDSNYLINDWNSKNIKESVELLLTEDDLIPLSGNGSGDVDPRPYKVYTAIIRQANTDAPTLQVLENTLNLTLTPSYNSPGKYPLSPNVLLPLNKTTVDIGAPHPDANTSTFKFQYTVIQSTDSLMQLNTFQAGVSTWSQTDNCIRNNIFEIRVYN